MDNPETLVTVDTLNTERTQNQNTIQKTEKISNTV
jgi:hypothetical protein